MIGYGMLYAVAVGLPIVLAAVVLSAFLRKHGRAERGVWIAALALALALPVILLARPSASVAPTPTPVAASGLIGLPTVVTVPDVAPVTVPIARSPLGLDEILLRLWLLASFLLVARWAVAAVRLARVLRACPIETVDGVRVSLTSDLGPAVAGWIRPRIVVPAWLMSLPQHQRSLVLMHEEEHVRAWDPVLLVVSRVVRILTPWNPVVWLLSSRLLRAVELDCDRRVLDRHPDVEAYGTTLLTVSARDPGALLGAAAFAEHEAPLRRRILAMTTPRGTVSILSLFTAMVLGVLLLVGAFQVPIPRLSQFRSDASSSDVGGGQSAKLEELLRESLAAQAAARAEQEATTARVANLQEQLARLEASQAEATQRAAAAEELLAQLDHARRDARSTAPTNAASAGTITGTVRDVATDQPIARVQIFLHGTGIGTLTNEQGRFLLLNVPAGDQQVITERIGYGAESQAVSVVGGGTAVADFGLRQAAVETDPVIVTAGGAEQSGLAGVASIQGGGSPLIFIDGIRIRKAQPSDLGDLISAEEIDRVEVIKGEAAVGLYGEEARAGVVRIYRKQPPPPETSPVDVAAGPTFTPFTVAPHIQNMDEVRQAMKEAYPPELRDEKIGGTVEVYFFITEEGEVQDTRISKSSGNQALDDAALTVANVFRFSPALNRDERVAVWVVFPITFLSDG